MKRKNWKHFKETFFNEYDALKMSGMTEKELCVELMETWEFPVHKAEQRPASDVRISYQAWKTRLLNDVDTNKEFKKVARARNNLLINQKIITKQKNLLNNNTNIVAFREMIVDAVKENFNIKENEFQYKIKNCDVKTPLYVISDEHYRGNIDDELIQKVFANIIDDVINNEYQNITICFLGDNVDGLLHKGSLSSNEGAIIPTIKYANLLSNLINSINENVVINARGGCGVDIKFVNSSNHNQTRPLNSNRNELAKEDLGLVIEEILNAKLSKWTHKFEANDCIIFEHNNKTIALLHGHQKYASSRIRMIDWWNARNNQDVDMIIMGHYHTFKANKYGKNKWMVVAPAVKNFMTDYDLDHGFPLDSSILKITWNEKYPEFKIIDSERIIINKCKK